MISSSARCQFCGKPNSRKGKDTCSLSCALKYAKCTRKAVLTPAEESGIVECKRTMNSVLQRCLGCRAPLPHLKSARGGVCPKCMGKKKCGNNHVQYVPSPEEIAAKCRMFRACVREGHHTGEMASGAGGVALDNNSDRVLQEFTGTLAGKEQRYA